MLLKICGCIMIVCGCSAIGFSLGNDYVLRIKHLERMKKNLLLLEGEIKYCNSGIVEALSKISRQSGGIFSIFFETIVDDLTQNHKTLKEAWDASVQKNIKNHTKLTNQDIRIIGELGECLGITDRETQIHNIENTKNQIDSIIGELNKIKTEKCKIYRTLGVVAGMFIAIVLL